MDDEIRIMPPDIWLKLTPALVFGALVVRPVLSPKTATVWAMDEFYGLTHA
jgi:hypothetical protein